MSCLVCANHGQLGPYYCPVCNPPTFRPIPDPTLALRVARLERLLLLVWPRCISCTSLATHAHGWIDGITYTCEGHSTEHYANRMVEADDIEELIDAERRNQGGT